MESGHFLSGCVAVVLTEVSALWGLLLSQIDSFIECFVCSLFVEVKCVHWGEYFFPRILSATVGIGVVTR
jgi:hypothetical protein